MLFLQVGAAVVTAWHGKQVPLSPTRVTTVVLTTPQA